MNNDDERDSDEEAFNRDLLHGGEERSEEEYAPRRRQERRRGWWGLACWNGLSAEQQTNLIEVGNLPFPWIPLGECPNGANVSIETEIDLAPGPRFYCWTCAAAYIKEQLPVQMLGDEGG